MDPGTALSIAQLVYGTTRDLYDYYRAWKDCDRDVEELRVQLLWLHDAFGVIRNLLLKPESSSSKDASQLIYSALEDCKSAASELWDKLEKVKSSGSSKTMIEKLKAKGRRACYPFHKVTIAEITDRVETCRDALKFALDLLHLDLSTLTQEKLQLIDKNLTNGFENIDQALQQLPAIKQDTSLTKDVVVDIQKDVKAVNDRKAVEAALKWICAADYGQQQSDVLSRHKPGTDEWFLESSEFKSWRSGTTRTLFCPGHPGTGKTVLAAAVINHMVREVHSPQTPIVYVFCDYKRQNEQNAEHILSALLRQIVHAMGRLPQPMEELYNFHSNVGTRPSLEEVEAAIRSTIHHLTKVYIVIDALDECKTKARSRVLRFLRGLRDQEQLALLATSRVMPEIQDEVQPDSQLKVRAADADVKVYVESRLDELSGTVRKDDGLQQQIVQTITGAAEGMFLLARLHMDSLREKLSKKAIKQALEHLHRGSNAYDSTYEDALERISRQADERKSIALEAIGWAVFAQRPLTEYELEEALAIEIGGVEIDEDAVTPIDEVLSLCAGLLVKDEHSNIVRLVHTTAHEYLVRTADTWIPDFHTNLATKCMTYICFPEFDEGPHSNLEDLHRILVKNPFYEYAANHWVDHFNKCESKNDNDPGYGMETLCKLALSFFGTENLVRSAIQAGSSSNRPGSHYPTIAHVVAGLGSVQLMRMLVDLGYPIDLRDEYHRTPLWWAVFKGSEPLTKFMLRTGQVDSEAQDAFGLRPIFHAVSLGHVTLVKLLLEHDSTHVNQEYREEGTLLHVAAQSGNEDLVKALLSTVGIKPDMRNDEGQTPLWLAAKRGHRATVELLSSVKDVEINAQSVGGATALSKAAKYGHFEVVKLLLGYEHVDVDVQDAAGLTPLALAASMGHADIVRSLLNVSTNGIEIVDVVGRRPVMWALQSGQDDTIRYLLEETSRSEGSNLQELRLRELKRRDNLGCSFVHLSGVRNNCSGILLALRNGLDIDIVDHEGWTPLHWCAYFGSYATAELLLQNGADKSRRDIHGRSCAQIAGFAGRHREHITELLSPEGMNSNEVLSELLDGSLRAVCDACDHVSRASFLRHVDRACLPMLALLPSIPLSIDRPKLVMKRQ